MVWSVALVGVLLSAHSVRADLPALPNAPEASQLDHSSHALALRPGERVNDYILLSRVHSLPHTFAPSTALTLSEELPLLHPLADGFNGSSYLALALPNATSAVLELDAPPPPLSSPLGLPSPFEAELALASASSTFRLQRRVNRGAHGEVWRAVRADDPRGAPLVLKRMTLERGGQATLRSGLRERHFGRVFRGQSDRIARYVDTFEELSSLWLVFHDEGVSLHDLIYTPSSDDAPPPRSDGGEAPRSDDADGEGPAADESEAAGAAGGAGGGGGGGGTFVTLHPSHAWLQLRRQPGHCTLRHIVRQAFEGVGTLHARAVTHRDLKPANTIIQAGGFSSSSGRGSGRAASEGKQQQGAGAAAAAEAAGSSGGELAGGVSSARASAPPPVRRHFPCPPSVSPTLAARWTRRCSSLMSGCTRRAGRAWRRRRRATSRPRRASAQRPSTPHDPRLTTFGRWAFLSSSYSSEHLTCSRCRRGQRLGCGYVSRGSRRRC